MNENEIREDPAHTHTDILDISDVNTEAEERDEDDIEQIEPTYTKESQELLKGVMTKWLTKMNTTVSTTNPKENFKRLSRNK